MSTACTIHGFAGTFESVLYKVIGKRRGTHGGSTSSICLTNILSCDLQDVMISIAPQSHSPGMFSWFPLFIPLANPLRVHVDDIITVNVWRY